MSETVIFSGTYTEEENSWLLQSSSSPAQVRFKKEDVQIGENIIYVKIGSEGDLIKKPFSTSIDPEFRTHHNSECKGNHITYCIAGVQFCCDGGKVIGGCGIFDHWICA